MEVPARQLLVFRFGPGANFGGGLLGALERLQSETSLRVRDLIFAAREPESGELRVLTLDSAKADGLAVATIDFRLDEAGRRRRSEAALAAQPELAALGDSLGPGEALAAVLVEHRWLDVLGEAVGRSGGEAVRAEFVDADSLVELLSSLTG